MSEFTMEELAPLIQEVVASEGEFRLFPRGTSMLPLLRQGVDSVALVALHREPKRGDVLLYQRTDGAYVLHRLMKVKKDGSLVFSGDNHLELEYGIQKDQLLALVSAVYRKDKKKSMKGWGLRLYSFFMTVSWWKKLLQRIRFFLAKIRKKRGE